MCVCATDLPYCNHLHGVKHGHALMKLVELEQQLHMGLLLLNLMYLTTVFACAPDETISDQGHGIEPGAEVAENAHSGELRQDGH